MHVLVVSQHYLPERCAPAARLSELCRQWVERGHRATVLTAMPNHPDGRLAAWYRRRVLVTERVDGVEVVRAPLWTAANRGAARRALSHGSFAVSAGLWMLALGRPDVVVATSPPLFAAAAAAEIARLRRVPCVLDIRDLWPDVFAATGALTHRPTLGVLEALERRMMRRATRAVVVSPSFVDHVSARVRRGVSVRVIPNGADLAHWSDGAVDPVWRARLLGGSEAGTVALYIGNHGVAQGLDAVLDAAAAAPHVRFAFVGAGSERVGLMAAAQARGVDATWLPAVNRADVLACQRAADLCIVPLRAVPELQACIPSKLFEIMACGRPVVAALGGPAAAIVRAADAGIVTAPGDGAAIGRAVADLAADPERRRRLGANARRHVAAHYDRAVLADRYLDLLSDVVSGGGGSGR